MSGTWLGQTRQVVSRFHRDERGMETLQTVAITAIGALVLMLVNKWVGGTDDGDGESIAGWVQARLDEVFDVNFTD